MIAAADVKAELLRHADPVRAKGAEGFFKIGPGQYGEGDRFLGVTQASPRPPEGS